MLTFHYTCDEPREACTCWVEQKCLSLWICFGLTTLVSCRDFLWRARKTSRRSWANSCCSASSSPPSLHSGQVWAHHHSCVFLFLSGFQATLHWCYFPLQVVTLSARPLTSSLPSVWVWSTCSTSALTESVSSNLWPAGLPTLRGTWACESPLGARILLLLPGYCLNRKYVPL